MKKLLLISALALTSALVVTPHVSAQSAQFVFSPTSFPGRAPGSSITFSINLVVTTGGTINNVQGLTYFLQQNGAAPFVFSLTNRSAPATNGSMFSDAITASPTYPQALNPSNAQDLGALAPNPLPSGTYFIADITLSIAANAAPGTYTIQSTTTGGKTSVINNSNGDTFPIQAGSTTITVVPEPSTYALLGMAGLGLAVVAYRRRAVAC